MTSDRSDHQSSLVKDDQSAFKGYGNQYTVDCERVLVTLLRGLGPWKESVFLVGGLTPRYLVRARRYLVRARPPEMPAHVGTLDVDIVIDRQILADTAGYHTLEENLRALGFDRSMNDRGQRLSWRWQTRTENGALMVVELLADAPEIADGRVEPLPTEGNISALNIPHSSIVMTTRPVVFDIVRMCCTRCRSSRHVATFASNRGWSRRTARVVQEPVRP